MLARAVLVVALAIVMPVAALSAQTVDPRAGQLLDEIIEVGRKDGLAPALVKIDQALKKFAQPGRERGAFLNLRAAALRELGRGAEALGDAEQAAAMAPDFAQARLLLAELQLQQGSAIDASRTIVYLSDRHPEAIRTLNSPWVGELLRRLDTESAGDARFELAMALSSRDFTDPEWPGSTDVIRAEAIAGLIRRDRIDEARRLMAGLTNVETQITMLVDREYQPLWRELEFKAGPKAARLLADDLAAAQQTYKRDPDNLVALRAYATALRGRGRSREAAALMAPHTGDLAAIKAGGSRAFWLVNEAAYALIESGQPEAGDRLLARLLTLSVAEDPNLINMAINRGAMLLDANRPSEALAATAFVDAQGPNAVSDYGRMWNWQVRACALHALGRTAEARPILDQMLTIKAKNYSAYTLAMLCNDRLDEVEQVIVERLALPEERGDMLLALQDFKPGATTSLTVAMRDKLLALRNRLPVRKAIEASGRILRIDADRTYWGSF